MIALVSNTVARAIDEQREARDRPAPCQLRDVLLMIRIEDSEVERRLVLVQRDECLHRVGRKRVAEELQAHEAGFPALARSIAAMSIRFMVIMASIARFAAALSGSAMAFISARGTICQDSPNLSLHQLHCNSSPPFSTIAFQ